MRSFDDWVASNFFLDHFFIQTSQIRKGIRRGREKTRLPSKTKRKKMKTKKNLKGLEKCWAVLSLGRCAALTVTLQISFPTMSATMSHILRFHPWFSRFRFCLKMKIIETFNELTNSSAVLCFWRQSNSADKKWLLDKRITEHRKQKKDDRQGCQ